MNESGAAGAIRNGTVAAVLSASVTALVAITALVAPSRTSSSLSVVQPGNLFDVGLVLGLAYGLHRRSRVCAFLLFAYALANSVFVAVVSKGLSGLPIQLILLYFFGKAARATLILHRSARAGSIAQIPSG
jgi:hypothetical protein